MSRPVAIRLARAKKPLKKEANTPGRVRRGPNGGKDWNMGVGMTRKFGADLIAGLKKATLGTFCAAVLALSSGLAPAAAQNLFAPVAYVNDKLWRGQPLPTKTNRII